MPTLIDNLNQIESIKTDIRSAIQNKGVDMTGASFIDYPSKIGEIQTGGTFVTETLSVSVNGTYIPGQGVDGFSQVVVDVPQSVTGFTEKEITEVKVNIVNLNNDASYVGSYAFEEHQTLQTVSLPNCTSIYHNAFQSCNNLSEVYLPVCLIIGDSAFYNNHSIINISLPECTYIGANAFQYNTELTSVSLSKCSIISNYAFWNCSKLTNVYLPECEKLGNNVFANDSLLVSVYLPKCSVLNGNVFQSCSSLTRISLPECISMAGYVFQNCKSLVSLNLSICYSIGSNICNGCSSLEEFTLPMTYYFFSYGNMLVNTKIARGIGSIYVADFNYNRYISATGWSSLASRFVSVPCSNTLFYSDGLVYGGTDWLEYSFISYLGLNNYLSITNISLPNCKSLTGQMNYNPPKLPFGECKNLQSITLGLSIASINLCSMLSYLTTVSLSNCKYISYQAFAYCSSLSYISVPECEYISYKAFTSCKSLQSIDLPKCSYIGESVFANCSSLSYISVPECEYISKDAFYACAYLQSVDLPKCSYIGESAFRICSSLEQITIRYSSICVLADNHVFEYTPIIEGNGSIFVPASLVDAYKSANFWSDHSSHIFPIE